MRSIVFLQLLTFLATACVASGCAGTMQESTNDLSEFDDSAHHWYDVTDEDKIIEPLPDQQRYSPDRVTEIADNILLFQKANGGWPKNYDMRAILTDEQKKAVLATRNATNTTFDNGATYSQVTYLAHAYTRTGIERYREACLRGIEFILSAQYPNGGWPQFFPDTSGYRKYITFNDGAMIGVMRLLQRIVREEPAFAFVGDSLCARVRAAFARGIECILRCQIVEDGRKLVWCQQHDHRSFEPRPARAFELPSLANQESAGIVLFLMSLEKPDARVCDAVESAVRWFEQSRMFGIRVVSVEAPPARFLYHSSSDDVVVVEDSAAPPVWPRFSELRTHRPLFANRDGKPVYSLAEVERERRTGYAWYTYEPQKVLDRYPAWKRATGSP